MNRFSIGVAVAIGAGGLLHLAGCAASSPQREERMARGYVFYLDGAGGGGALRNYAGGVRTGLQKAGYEGAGEIFSWQTGFGVIPDQTASVEYKRGKARQLAELIRRYQTAHPGGQVTLMGLSAGTAVAVFTLEELPLDAPVDNVVLLAGSLSSDYDATEALKRVRGKTYVFTSQRDAVLRYLAPLGGTADRSTGATIGLTGFTMPPNASAETYAQYAKLVSVAWRPEFKEVGHHGGHTDVVRAGFIENYVAPLIMETTPPAATLVAAEADRIRNPDYARWASFGVGSWAEYEGTQTMNDEQRAVRLRAQLVAKNERQLIVERTYTFLGADADRPPVVKRFFVQAWISPEEHPATHPSSVRRQTEQRRFAIDDQSLTCNGVQLTAPADFEEWGADLTAEYFADASIPGGIVQMNLTSHVDGRPVAFSGALVGRRVVR